MRRLGGMLGVGRSSLIAAPAWVGPLDGMTAPAAAYSLRRLLTSYTGPLIRVRNGPGDEMDIESVDGFLDTTAILDFCDPLRQGGIGKVAKWYDQSGNGHDLIAGATEDSNDYYPLIYNNESAEEFGGFPAIKFLREQMDTGMFCRGPIAANSAYRKYCAIIGKSVNLGQYAVESLIDADHTLIGYRNNTWIDNGTINIYAGSVASDDFDYTSVPRSVVSIFNGEASHIILDGLDSGAVSSGSDTLMVDTLRIGNRWTAAGDCFNGHFLELVIVTSEETAIPIEQRSAYGIS